MTQKVQTKKPEAKPNTEVAKTENPMANLPADVQKALAKFQLRERVGVAPQWKPENADDFLIGRVVGAGQAGKYDSIFLTFNTPDGVQTVWMNGDLKMKLAKSVDEGVKLIGKDFLVLFKGWLTVAENPRLANDMREYLVMEVLGPQSEVAPGTKPIIDMIS